MRKRLVLAIHCTTAGAQQSSPLQVAQGYAQIRPQLCNATGVLGLAQSQESRIVQLCFRTRKGKEAWSPGNFGCRGLLVYGLLTSDAGCASSSFSRFDLSGNGYLFALAQLNRSTRSSPRTHPQRSALRHAASTAPPSGQNRNPSARAATSTACRMCSSDTAIAAPPLSRTAHAGSDRCGMLPPF